MGYRSQVLIALKNDDFNRLLNECNDEIGIEILQGCNVSSKSDWKLLHYDWIKWYDGYKDVDYINGFVSSLEGDYEFHRMGEESDDYECKGTGESPFNIRLVRHVEFDEF